METFLSIIFFTILAFWLISIVGRWLLRRWILKKQREMEERFGGAGGYTYKQYTWGTGSRGRRQRTAEREGEVEVRQTERIEKKVSGAVGDYVDYEEIKDSE